MKSLAFVTQKGGAGKTTLAISCAVEASQKYKTLLLDTDPQESLAEWFEKRPQDIPDDRPNVITCGVGELSKTLKAAEKAGYEMVIVDTPGHQHPEIGKAIAAVDLVLIPIQPSAIDMKASRETLRTIDKLGDAKTSFAFLVNRGSPNPRAKRGKAVLNSFSSLVKADPTLSAFGTVCPVEIPQLVAFVDSYPNGLGVQEFDPKSRAATVMQELWQWVDNHFSRIAPTL